MSCTYKTAKPVYTVQDSTSLVIFERYVGSTCVATGIHLFLGITPRYLPMSMCKRKLQRLGEHVWMLYQCVCCCCRPAAHVPAPCRGSTALLLLALTGKGQLCRCSAAWIEAPTPLFPWDISSPPVH